MFLRDTLSLRVPVPKDYILRKLNWAQSIYRSGNGTIGVCSTNKRLHNTKGPVGGRQEILKDSSSLKYLMDAD